MGPRSTNGGRQKERPLVEATPGELLAEAVKEAGLLSADVIDRLLMEHPEPRELYQHLLDEGELPEEELRLALHEAFLYPTIDLQVTEVDSGLAAELGAGLLQERLVLPLVGSGPSGRLMIAMANPTDRETIREIEQIAQRPSSICLALPTRLLERVERHFAPRLVGVLPSGEAVEAILNHSETSIGKAGHNRLVLGDETVSGSHAIVLSEQGRFSLLDMGSRNGTYLNNQRLGQDGQSLADGDQIRLGRIRLVFQDPNASLPERTPFLPDDVAAASGAPPRTLPFPADWERTEPEMSPWEEPASENGLPSPEFVETSPPQAEPPPVEPAPAREVEGRGPRTSRWAVWGLAGIALLAVAIFFFKRQPTAERPTIPQPLERTGAETLTASGNWERFGKIGGLVSVSAVAHRPGSGGVLLAGTNQIPGLFWVPVATSGSPRGSLFDLPAGMAPLVATSTSPTEALAYGNGFYYELSPPRRGAQGGQRLHRIAISSNGVARRESTVEVSELVRSLAPPSSGGMSQPPVATLAWNPIREELLLVLSPLATTGETLLVPLRMVDPLGPFGGRNLTIGSPSFLPLDLNGETVRAMTYVASRKSFLLVTRGQSTVQLWEWSGTSQSRPSPRMVLDPHPEPSGILALPRDNQELIVLTGRRGTYLTLTSQTSSP